MLYLKKNPCSDLSKDVLVFRLLGFVFALSFAFITFSFTTFKKQSNPRFSDTLAVDDVTVVVVRMPNEIKTIPVPKPQRLDNQFKLDKTNSTPTDLLTDNPIPEPTDNPGPTEPRFNDPVIEEPINVIITSQKPKFKGGEFALESFIDKYMVYPEDAYVNGIEGVVNVLFDINPDGSISNVRAKENGPIELVREAIRVIKLTNYQWIPARQQERPVKVSGSVPITFIIK